MLHFIARDGVIHPSPHKLSVTEDGQMAKIRLTINIFLGNWQITNPTSHINFKANMDELFILKQKNKKQKLLHKNKTKGFLGYSMKKIIRYRYLVSTKCVFQ